MSYKNSYASLGDIVGSYFDYHNLSDGNQLSIEQMHDLADIISVARHDYNGERPVTREIIALSNRDGDEIYREEILFTNGNVEGEI